MSLRALVRLAFVVSTVSICVLRAQDSGWILTNVQIVDLERGRVLDARTLHIRDDRIAAIVESPTAVQVAGLRTIDGQGSFVIPGLFDMHVHLVTNGAETPRRPPGVAPPGSSVVFQDRSGCSRRSGHGVSD